MSEDRSKSNSCESFYSAFNTGIENEDRYNDFSKALSPFLHQYEHEIENLHAFYLTRQLDLLETGERDFFEINCFIFEFIKNNIDEMNEFIQNRIIKNEMEMERILCLWEKLHLFLTNQFQCEGDNFIVAADSSILDNDFNKLLLSLANEEFANQNEMEKYLWSTEKNDRQCQRTVEEFARFFLMVLFNVPTYVVYINEDFPVIELKIYLLEINYQPYDCDIMYFFLRKNDGPSVNQSTKLNSNLTLDAIEIMSEPEEINLQTDKPVEENHRMLSKVNEISNVQDDSSTDEIKKYYSSIRMRFNFNKNSECRFFTMTSLKKPALGLILLKLLLSFLSINDVFVDISLICKFFQTGNLFFAILTICILIIVGTINIFFERQNLRENTTYSNYLPNFLNCLTFNYICGFLQLSKFLRTLQATIFLLKARSEKQIETLLKMIIQNDSCNLQWETLHQKYIETYLESIPQIILQIYIILNTNEWGWLQLLSIFGGVTNINFSIMSFAAMEMKIRLSNMWRHPIVILNIFCYNGFLLTSYILLFWQFHWAFSFTWTILHLLISYFSKWNEQDETLICINFKIPQLEYWTIFNKMTLLENIFLIGILCLHTEAFTHLFYNILFVSHVMFSAIWTFLIIRNKFYFSLNVMYTPFLIRHRSAY